MSNERNYTLEEIEAAIREEFFANFKGSYNYECNRITANVRARLSAQTQAGAKAFKFFRCLDCGYNGTITEEEIARHRSRCAIGTTEGTTAPVPADARDVVERVAQAIYEVKAERYCCPLPWTYVTLDKTEWRKYATAALAVANASRDREWEPIVRGIEWIQKVASGEQQIAEDDTEGMNYIDRYAQDLLEQIRTRLSRRASQQEGRG